MKAALFFLIFLSAITWASPPIAVNIAELEKALKSVALSDSQWRQWVRLKSTCIDGDCYTHLKALLTEEQWLALQRIVMSKPEN